MRSGGVRVALAVALLATGCASLDSDTGATGSAAASAVADSVGGADPAPRPVNPPAVEAPADADPVLDELSVRSDPTDPGGWSVPEVPITRAESLEEAGRPDVAPPVRLRLDSVGIDAAITDVGVRLDGDLEVPEATEIGWYRFGPEPGEPGSSVVAAHVDYNGRPGAFFPLRETAIGDVLEIDRSDGSTLRFEVVAVDQYDKDELPDDLWRRDGEPQVVLITCGGPFDRRERSYQDNVVVTAIPLP